VKYKLKIEIYDRRIREIPKKNIFPTVRSVKKIKT
jgi:hypothetical protein